VGGGGGRKTTEDSIWKKEKETQKSVNVSQS
jgi:hypothetical protein